MSKFWNSIQSISMLSYQKVIDKFILGEILLNQNKNMDALNFYNE